MNLGYEEEVKAECSTLRHPVQWKVFELEEGEKYLNRYLPTWH
jgi:hypothetical protein